MRAAPSPAKSIANPGAAPALSTAAEQNPAVPADPGTPERTSALYSSTGTVRTHIDGDGTYLVGVDIEPGRYRTFVPTSSFNCFWQRLRNTSGQESAVIANGNNGGGTRFAVVIADDDVAFTTTGCGVWQRTG